MSKTSEELDDVLDITPVEATTEEVIKKPTKKPLVISSKSEDQEKDYQYARAHLYDIVEKMQETLNSAMDVAAETEHPRAFEVAFQGARNAADVVEKISDLHKKMKDLETEEVKVQQNNTQNVFMSGSTADLLKMLKNQSDK